MDSLRYAKTIQESVLPLPQTIARAFSNHFVIYKPKDLVSGDFYWMAQTSKYTFIATVDCTGHGIPGAFMSLIGYKLLENIVRKDEVFSPSKMLGLMNAGIRTVLQQDQQLNSDGMDVSLCRLSYANNDEVELLYAGAKRPLFFTQNDELVEQKGARVSVGGYQKVAHPVYQEHRFLLKKGDYLYLTTDGFVDQNSLEGKKYGTKRLRNLLKEIHTNGLHEQHQILKQELQEHQGTQEQRDDITVLGVEL